MTALEINSVENNLSWEADSRSGGQILITFYGTRKFNIVLIRYQWTVFWATWIESTLSRHISLRSAKLRFKFPDFIFAWRWRLKSRLSEFWHRVVMWYDTNISEHLTTCATLHYTVSQSRRSRHEDEFTVDWILFGMSLKGI